MIKQEWQHLFPWCFDALNVPLVCFQVHSSGLGGLQMHAGIIWSCWCVRLWIGLMRLQTICHSRWDTFEWMKRRVGADMSNAVCWCRHERFLKNLDGMLFTYSSVRVCFCLILRCDKVGRDYNKLFFLQ